MRRGDQDFDQFDSGLYFDLRIVEIGEGPFQVDLGFFRIPSALLRDPNSAWMRQRSGFNSKATRSGGTASAYWSWKKRSTQIGLAVEVLGIQRDDPAQQGNRELRLLLLKVLLYLCFQVA